MYNSFAKVYDRLTDDVDYDRIFQYVEKIFAKYQVNPELVLELACGSGNFTKRLVDSGYDVIGIDSSVEMLDIAKEKCPQALLLQQDMTDFELYGTVDAIICILDGVNYVTDKRKLRRMFKWVENYLNPEGIFIFDIITSLRNWIDFNKHLKHLQELFVEKMTQAHEDISDLYQSKIQPKIVANKRGIEVWVFDKKTQFEKRELRFLYAFPKLNIKSRDMLVRKVELREHIRKVFGKWF